MDVYWALWLTRGWRSWLGARGVARLGAGAAGWRPYRHEQPLRQRRHGAAAEPARPLCERSFHHAFDSEARFTDRSCARLLAAAALVGYPTALDRLAVEQLEGRLSLDIVLAVSVSEWVEPAARARIEAAFGCPLRDSYAASEFLALGFECPEGWLT